MRRRSLPLLLLLAVLILSLPGLIRAAAPEEFPDGTYSLEVELEGGSGRASVSSPATVYISDGTARAQIEWSSSHYDYMIVDGEQYLPLHEGGSSVFEIPVSVFDEPITVIADTTAMSVPHEISYQLTFRSDGISAAGSGLLPGFFVLILCLALILSVFVAVRRRRKKNHG